MASRIDELNNKFYQTIIDSPEGKKSVGGETLAENHKRMYSAVQE
jgi:hypothetical protein